MSVERAVKLKRKKSATKDQGLQEVEVRLQSPPALNVRQDSAGSWFDEIDLTASEQAWKGVLSAAYPDLRSLGWGAVPALPHFSNKVIGKEREKTASGEVFKIGEQSFKWFPLPVVQLGGTAVQPRSINADAEIDLQKSKNLAEPITDASPKGGLQSLNAAGQSESRPVILLSNLQKKLACSETSIKNVKQPETLQKVSKKKAREPPKTQTVKNVEEPQTSQRAFPKNVKELQQSQIFAASTKKASQKWSFHSRPTVTPVKCKIELEQEHQREEPLSNDVVMMEAAEEEASASGRQLEEIRECADKSEDVTGSLQNCPICLMQFPMQFSQLDMDSHLAQCLSETTIDVVW